jgi:hypothetical protein
MLSISRWKAAVILFTVLFVSAMYLIEGNRTSLAQAYVS